MRLERQADGPQLKLASPPSEAHLEKKPNAMKPGRPRDLPAGEQPFQRREKGEKQVCLKGLGRMVRAIENGVF